MAVEKNHHRTPGGKGDGGGASVRNRGGRRHRRTRGVITLIDRNGLEEIANASYGVHEAEYKRLMRCLITKSHRVFVTALRDASRQSSDLREA
jgi:hypothetical protein